MPATRQMLPRRIRPLLWPILVVLTLATGLTLLGLEQVLTADPIPHPAEQLMSGANLAVIRAFYAAANHTLQTGDPTGLAPLLAPNLIEHRLPLGTVAGQADLLQALVTLHAGFPHIRLVVDDLVAQADEVVARVHLSGVAPGEFAGLALPTAVADWGELDFFRLDRGIIVEHWGERDSSVALRPLQQGALVLPSPRSVLSLSRLTFPPADTAAVTTWNGPKFLYLEAGQLTVTISPSLSEAPEPAVLTHVTHGVPTTSELVKPGQPVTLVTGDLLALPPSLYLSATGGAGKPAVCLALALRLAVPFAAEAIHGPQVQHLADGLPDLLTRGSVTITLGAITLAPGVSLPLTTRTESTLIAVNSGALGMTITTGGGWLQRGVDGTSEAMGALSGVLPETGTSSGPPGQGTPPSTLLAPTTLLASGDTALVEAGASGVIRNAGDTPLSLLVMSLSPNTADAGTPVPEPATPLASPALSPSAP